MPANLPPEPTDKERDLCQTLNALYARVPDVRCKGKCGEACGPIGFWAVEAANITRRGLVLPTLQNHPDHGDLTCSALGTSGKQRNRCTIYAVRPLICRLFGAVKKLRCPYGCKPKARFLTEEERNGMAEEVVRLSIALCGSPKPQFTAPSDLMMLIETMKGKF